MTYDPEYAREWRERNRERVKAYAKAYYAENRDQLRADQRAAYAADPDAFKARVKQYRDSEPEKVREQKRRYRAKNSEKETARIKKWIQDNPDRADVQNAKRCLRDQTGIAIRDIPKELAEAKAAQLKIDRWLREQLAAQGIEAGTAETVQQGSVHESPVLEEDAPKLSHRISGEDE